MKSNVDKIMESLAWVDAVGAGPLASGLCPICGENISLTDTITSNGRLVGTCGDAFTLASWIDEDQGEDD